MEEKKNIKFDHPELLAKYLSNEVDSSEKIEVEAWLNQSEENREYLEQSRKMLDNIDAFYEANRFDSGVAWQNI